MNIFTLLCSLLPSELSLILETMYFPEVLFSRARIHVSLRLIQPIIAVGVTSGLGMIYAAIGAERAMSPDVTNDTAIGSLINPMHLSVCTSGRGV